MRKSNYSVEAIMLKSLCKAVKVIANRMKNGQLDVYLIDSTIQIVDKDYGTFTLNIRRFLKQLREPSE